MNKYFIIFSAFITASSYTVTAQSGAKDTTLPSQRIEIIQEYKPEVKLPEKPIIKPSTLQFSNGFPVPVYDYIKQEDAMKFGYEPIKIKPLALLPVADAPLYQNYVGVGFGNYRTIFADAGLSYHKPGRYDASVHGYHLSQQGGKSFPDRRSSLTDVNLSGKYIFPKISILGQVGVEHRALTQYGYDHSLYTFPLNDIKLSYTTLYLNAAVSELLQHTKGFKVKPAIQAYFTNTKAGQSESLLGIQLPFHYNINTVATVHMGINTQLSSFNYGQLGDVNGYLQLDPAISFTKKKLYARLGASPVLRSQGGWGIMPNIAFRYAFGDDARVAVNMGLVGDVVMYSLRNMMYKNPYFIAQSVGNTRHQRIYLGMEMALLKNVKAEFKATYHKLDVFQVWANDYSNLAGNKFNALGLADFNYFSLYGAGQIMVTDRFLLALNGDLNIWGGNASLVYHEPSLKMGIQAHFKPIPELKIGMNADVWNGMKYLDQNQVTRELDPIFNLGLSADYDIMKRYGLFLKMNNIANSSNAMWYQYPVYGFNIFGGIKVKF